MVRKELRSRHRRMLARFVSNVDIFLTMMRTTNTIISGSFALHYAEGDGRWTSHDLDVYTSHDTHDDVVKFFRGEGYTEYVSPESKEVVKPINFKKYRSVRIIY